MAGKSDYPQREERKNKNGERKEITTSGEDGTRGGTTLVKRKIQKVDSEYLLRRGQGDGRRYLAALFQEEGDNACIPRGSKKIGRTPRVYTRQS